MTAIDKVSEADAISAQARLHHQYFLGLQLLVAVEESRATVFNWMVLFQTPQISDYAMKWQERATNNQITDWLS